MTYTAIAAKIENLFDRAANNPDNYNASGSAYVTSASIVNNIKVQVFALRYGASYEGLSRWVETSETGTKPLTIGQALDIIAA